MTGDSGGGGEEGGHRVICLLEISVDVEQLMSDLYEAKLIEIHIFAHCFIVHFTG